MGTHKNQAPLDTAAGYPFDRKCLIPLYATGLEWRTRAVLAKGAIYKVCQLQGASVWRYPGIGPARMALIDDALRRIGLALDRSRDGGVLVEISDEG